MRGRYRVLSLLMAAALLSCVPVLGGCKPPAPALTKAELDEAKLPDEHPEVAEPAENGCRACHREQPAIKKQ